MPRLWLANAEEALPDGDSFFAEFFAEKTMKMFPRFLVSLQPGDCLVIPDRLSEKYVHYINDILQLGDPAQRVLSVQLDRSCFLVESVLNDSLARQIIAEKFSGPEWSIEPYISTERAVKLSRVLNLPLRGTAREVVLSGYVEQLNNKAYFKSWASELGIPVIPGREAHNFGTLRQAIELIDSTLPRPGQDEIMLRKVKFAGGAGNYHGKKAKLLSVIKKWYSGGHILVEPFLKLGRVCGSLAEMTDEGVTWLGQDVQFFRDGSWHGFDSPFEANSPDEAQGAQLIKEGTLKLAESAWQRGARGQINFDWAFRLNPDKSGQGVVAVECNFRQNGFGYIIDLARKYFPDNWRELYICSREEVATSVVTGRFLHEILSFLTYEGEPILIEQPGARRGAVVTVPPIRGGFSLCIFGDSRKYTEEVYDMIVRSVSSKKVSRRRQK